MSNLILAVIGLILTAIAGYSAIVYIPTTQITASKAQPAIEKSLSQLESAYESYRKYNAENPASGSSVDIFSSYYKFKPVAPTGMAWTYGVGADSVSYFCLASTSDVSNISKGVFSAAIRIKSYYPQDQLFVNTDGASACGSGENKLSNFEGKLSITMRVKP